MLMAVLIAIGIMAAIGAIFGLVLGFASLRFKVESDPIVDQINEILPQTQCGQCGYPGCRPYAEAIANGDDITKCPPGGQAGIEKIAQLLGVDVPVDADDVSEPIKTVAIIHEDMCIGCTKCIQACPVDAIVGSNKLMHTVIEADCTGCDLCVAPCPTDCIEMIPVATTPDTWKWTLNSIPVTNISNDPQSFKTEPSAETESSTEIGSSNKTEESDTRGNQ